MEKRFNIRVYGILINDQQQLLCTDEFRLGMCMTKFPGGGLEFGEGPVDCILRECLEEFGQEVRVLSHFYTTEYYQPTISLPAEQQLISIYYRITPILPLAIKISDSKFDFDFVDGAQSFRWLAIDSLDPSEFNFPIDRKVAAMVVSDFAMKNRKQY